MDLKEELNSLNSILKKRIINYTEFNDIIGNYYVLDYEELEDNYFLIKILTQNNHKNINNYYTDYIMLKE